MPRIAEITETKDGRPCVVLEMSGDDGAVSLYTQEEISDLLRGEREACARLLDEKAQELRRIRDPGMANHCQMLANLIRNQTDK